MAFKDFKNKKVFLYNFYHMSFIGYVSIPFELFRLPSPSSIPRSTQA